MSEEVMVSANAKQIAPSGYELPTSGEGVEGKLVTRMGATAVVRASKADLLPPGKPQETVDLWVAQADVDLLSQDGSRLGRLDEVADGDVGA